VPRVVLSRRPPDDPTGPARCHQRLLDWPLRDDGPERRCCPADGGTWPGRRPGRRLRARRGGRGPAAGRVRGGRWGGGGPRRPGWAPVPPVRPHL